MRKLVCIVLFALGASAAYAQHYVGVKGGYGATQGRIYTSYGPGQGAMMWNKYTAGFMWKYYSATPVWGGIAAELEYQQRGYRVYGEFPGQSIIIADDAEYRINTRTVSSVTLPVMWQPHLYMMNRSVRVWLSAGVTLSYNTGVGDELIVSRHNKDNTIEVIEAESGPYEMQRARDVRWGYGWLGGVGVGVLRGRWEFFAEGRYYYGMSDILRTTTKYQFNVQKPIRSELDNIYITMGIYFRLGKGGILAPPLRKRSATVSSDDFRNIKLDM